MLQLLATHVVPGYLDPGSGSLIFQAVVAAFLAASLTVKMYWRRVKGLFRRRVDE